MVAEKSLPVFGDGTTQRDYTYVDDIVDGIIQSWEWLQHGIPQQLSTTFSTSGAPTRCLCSSLSVSSSKRFVTAMIDWQPAQPGDVPITFADLRKSQALLGYRPQVDIATGIQRFAAWFQGQRSLSETA